MYSVTLTIILILNLHMTSVESILHDLVKSIASAVPGIHSTNELKKLNIMSVTPTEMIRQESYLAETHEITTEDGYILTVHRIPGPMGSIPVLLQHGLLESSADWLTSGREKSLAYILADNGYDVWIGNARGNTYSKKHKTLSPSDPQFWHFSWHELGVYDLPAVISYISELKKDSIFYIGHSMGATSFSVMALEKPDVAKNVRMAITLAPATYVHDVDISMKLLASFWRIIQRLSNTFGIYELLPRSAIFDNFAKYVCEVYTLRNVLCSNPLFLLAGFSTEQLDYSLLPAIWSKFPAGTSIKVLIHWFQQINDNSFRKFDYGPEMNMQLYNTWEPPDYDLSQLKVPVAVFWAKNDHLVGEKDIEHFYRQVPVKLGIYKVQDEKFNHFDFLWGIGAPRLVYPKILELMSESKNCINQN